MSTAWHPDSDTTPTPADVERIVEVLEGCHGVHAADVAEFFSTKHCLAGDAGRSWAWAGVAERVRMRAQARQASDILEPRRASRRSPSP